MLRFLLRRLRSFNNRSPRWSARATWCREHWLPQWRYLTDRPVRRRSGCVWCHFFRGLWGCRRFYPPKTRLGHGTVGALPIPMHATQFFTLGNQGRHDLGHDAVLVPALKPVMDRALGTKAFRQLIPLAPRTHSENDAVERQPPVSQLAAGSFLRPKLFEDRTDAIP